MEVGGEWGLLEANELLRFNLCSCHRLGSHSPRSPAEQA